MTTSTTKKIEVEQIAGLAGQVLDEVEKAVIGRRDVLAKILAAFLCPGGHVLLEDYPGLAKTLIANSFATALGMHYKRIQFTPDLLPGDITGGYIYDSSHGQFVLRKGPLFTQILLADEINRASPKTQSALLEAMQEYQVTLEGQTLPLDNPFIVVATQNPIEYEGTFPLPEAQLDRFIVKLSIGYPDADVEQQILRRRRERKQDAVRLEAVMSPAGFVAMRQAIEEVYVHADIERYIIDLVGKTRKHRQIVIGVSPRGSLALLKLARTWAAIQGRNYVLVDDVKEFAGAAMSHRLILEPTLWGSKKAENTIINEILQTVPVPVVQIEHE